MFSSSKSVTKISSWRNVQSYNENALQQAVALVGPVSAAINAHLHSFQVRYNDYSVNMLELARKGIKYL